MFCNNNKCEFHETCFRFLPKHSKSSNLLSTKNGKCQNFIEWTYRKEVADMLEKIKYKATKWHNEHTEYVNKLVDS